MSGLLNKVDIIKNMNNLSNHWRLEDIYLKANFDFKSFSDAITFMSIVGKKCDKLNHHPKWTNVYNKIEIELYTHDAGGITIKDFELSSFMDEVFSKNFK